MLLPVLAWIGFFTILSQVLLMRELLASFEGNELSLGVTLAAWLIWTGIGSAVCGVIVRRRPGPRLLAGLLALAGICLPLTLTGASLLPLLVEATRGQAAAPAMLACPFLLLLPLCVFSGGLFPAAGALQSLGMTQTRATGRVYLLEAFGGGLAGIAASFFLVGMPALPVVVTIGFANVVVAGSLLCARRRLVLAAVFLAASPLLLALANRLDHVTQRALWRGYDLRDSVSSPYGKLTLVAAEGEPVIFHDRVVLFGAADEQAIEERIHYALLEHPAPEKVLLLGGGSPSALAHVLKHRSVRKLDYLEADPALLGLFQRHFSQEWGSISSDQRVRIHRSDARRFIRTSDEKWDVIIVGLPPPQTILMNRYYTLEFFRETKRVLAPKGIIALQLPGAENYISEDLAQFVACVRKTLHGVFERVVVLPGSSVQLLAGAGSAESLTADPLLLVARVKERRLDSLYVREYTIPFRLTSDRVLELDRQTRGRAETPVNRDFAPVAYYLRFIVWGSTFGDTYRRLFAWFTHVPYWLVGLAALLALIGPYLAGRFLRQEQRRSRAVEACVGAMGTTMLGLQVILLLGFQASYGFLYRQLGLLTGAFMFGMSLGALLGLRTNRSRMALPALQLLVCLWLVIVYCGFRVAAETNALLAPYLLFAGLSLTTGLLGGWHFVVASAVWLGEGEGNRSLGTVYAVDLIGAALGAIVVAAFLLPVFGYTGTAGVLAVINLAAVAIFLQGRSRALTSPSCRRRTR